MNKKSVFFCDVNRFLKQETKELYTFGGGSGSNESNFNIFYARVCAIYMCDMGDVCVVHGTQQNFGMKN